MSPVAKYQAMAVTVAMPSTNRDKTRETLWRAFGSAPCSLRLRHPLTIWARRGVLPHLRGSDMEHAADIDGGAETRHHPFALLTGMPSP